MQSNALIDFVYESRPWLSLKAEGCANVCLINGSLTCRLPQ
ncbi:Uncharacterised protein [Vibrio cholerae]|nr:Uncharacterised protein [Vibrio cholerae]CSI95584.1 Uncharacterised protein [Vibrio cholerae]